MLIMSTQNVIFFLSDFNRSLINKKDRSNVLKEREENESKKPIVLRLAPVLREHVENESKRFGVTMSNYITFLLILDREEKNDHG